MKNKLKNRFMDSPQDENSRYLSKILMGLSVIAFGVLYLLHQIGFQLPDYLFSWEIILILVGLIVLVKHKFQRMSGYILIAIGGMLMINDFYPHAIEMRFIWPVLIIIFGISIFLKAVTRSGKKTSYTILSDDEDSFSNSDDYIESTAFFGGVTKNIVSKDFKGAKITTVFGGTELNLSHADFSERATIDLTSVFGGVTIIVPSSWKVNSEITSVFGGIDDKRQAGLVSEEQNKTLTLKGSCVFGGVEITSYV